MCEIRSISAEETLLIRQQVLWPDKPLDYVRIDNDNEGQHYGLFIENQLITVISVFIEASEAQFRKFATLENHRGKGYGRLIFEYMLNELEHQGIHKIWCNARLEANGFYKKYGFEVAENSVFSKGDVCYTIMEKYM